MSKICRNVVNHLFVVKANVNGKKRTIKVEADSGTMARQKAAESQRSIYGDNCTFRVLDVYRADVDEVGA